MTTYEKLEKLILPQLIHYKEDLTVIDKNILSNYKGRFLYGIRKSGTNLLKLETDSFELFTKTPQEIESKFHSLLTSLKYSNTRFYYFNGETIEEVTHNQMIVSFSLFAKETFYKKQRIDALNIDGIAYSLFTLMFEKDNWITKVLESNDSEMVKIKKNFNIRNIKISPSIEDIKNQLISNYKSL